MHLQLDTATPGTLVQHLRMHLTAEACLAAPGAARAVRRRCPCTLRSGTARQHTPARSSNWQSYARAMCGLVLICRCTSLSVVRYRLRKAVSSCNDLESSNSSCTGRRGAHGAEWHCSSHQSMGIAACRPGLSPRGSSTIGPLLLQWHLIPRGSAFFEDCC